MNEAATPIRRPVVPDAKSAAIAKVFAKFGEVRAPGDADEPILSPEVRLALRTLLTELNSGAELKALGLNPRRTALLYGPPGTGKTTFAHHFAARLGMPLVCVACETLVGKHLGAGGQNMSELHDAIDASSGKVVIFFDEIDSIGGRRRGEQACDTEMANTLNVMLRRIEQSSAITLGATNRQDSLDPALWRRFHMQVEIGLPGPDERWAIIKRYALPFDMPDDDLDLLADITDGASPSLLRQLMEGVKRATVMGPKMGQDISDPAAVYSSVVASVAPPPEMERPILWTPAGLGYLTQLSWPPVRPAAA